MQIQKKRIGLGILVWLLLLLFVGGIYSASRRKATVITGNCVGCSDCVRICPKDAVAIVKGKAVIDIDLCNGCGLCYPICSYNAIRITER